MNFVSVQQTHYISCTVTRSKKKKENDCCFACLLGYTVILFLSPTVGSADAEIKVSSAENPKLPKVLSFKFAIIQRTPPDHGKETQTAVVWSCLTFTRSGQNHLASHSEVWGGGERRQARQRKRWEDNIREWTGPI